MYVEDFYWQTWYKYWFHGVYLQIIMKVHIWSLCFRMDQDGLKRWKEFSASKWRDQVGRKVYGWWMLRTGTDRSSSESIVSICTRLGLWWNLYVGLWACFCVKNLRDLFFVAKGDVTIIMSDDDMVNLMLGKLNPQQVWLKWSA